MTDVVAMQLSNIQDSMGNSVVCTLPMTCEGLDENSTVLVITFLDALQNECVW